MKYLKKYKLFESSSYDRHSETKNTIRDMSLELEDNGLQVDIQDKGDLTIVIWKHKGDEWHMKYDFDDECIDFLLRLNDYMISNGFVLEDVTIVCGETTPNKRLTNIDDAIKTIKKLEILNKKDSNLLIFEVSITFKEL